MSTPPLSLSQHKQAIESRQNLARKQLENGYHPVPLEAGSKKPLASGWQNRLTTTETVERDFRTLGNIGLMLGVVKADKTFLVGIDIDIDDAPLISAVSQAIGDRCPEKRGKKGVTFLVRGIGDIRSGTLHDYRQGKKPAGDILAAGKQTVIPPSIHPNGSAYFWVHSMSSENTPYSELPLIDDSAIKEIRAFLKNAENPIACLNTMVWKGVGGGGDTHDTCVAAVGAMVAGGWADEQIHARIRRAKRQACEQAAENYNWPAEAKCIQEWVDSAREKGFAVKQAKAKASHGEHADQVLSLHGARIRRDKVTRDWLTYDGKTWNGGGADAIKTFIREYLPEYQVMSQLISGVEAVMRLYPSLMVDGEAWDADKHYLNCPDYTYNLKTGERMNHSPTHLLTKITRVGPDFDYGQSLWVHCLDTWFGADQVEINYVQTLFGLFLTGETKDECVTMWIGRSGAGKSIMTSIMSYIMGDYAQTATDTAFLDVRYHPHAEEIARMRGKRLVFIHEVEGNLNLRRVKSIASGEAISASFKGKDSFEFRPEAKLWFVGNEAPPTRSSGRELERRFHVYEFERQIEAKDMDLNLGTKLRAEASYILGWAMDGAKSYYATGLHRSPQVVQSTKRYFADADILEQFLEDRCVIHPQEFTSVANIFGDFAMWADESGVRQKPDKGRFAQRLKAKGYRLERRVIEKGSGSVRVVVGLRLRTSNELEEPMPTDQF